MAQPGLGWITHILRWVFLPHANIRSMVERSLNGIVTRLEPGSVMTLQLARLGSILRLEMKRLLLVDDDSVVLRSYRDRLSRHGFQVNTSMDATAAMTV